MSETDDNAIEQMRQAIAIYAGPVTRCPPGKARAPAEKKTVVRNASVEWLKQNRNARPIRDKKAERRKIRMAHAQQQRIAKRNAALLKRVNGNATRNLDRSDNWSLHHESAATHAKPCRRTHAPPPSETAQRAALLYS